MSKRISAGLRRQAPGDHLDADSLAAFSENALSPAERGQALEHLSSCVDCRETLFLAHPQAADDILAFAPKRTAYVIRWAALAAAVVVVASGVFLSRQELFRNHEIVAKQAPELKPFAKMADEKAAEQTSRETEVAGMPATANLEANSRSHPELKHMTAKPQAAMRFDSSGQVHFTDRLRRKPPVNLPAQTRDEVELRGLVATAPSASAAISADKAKADEMPQSVSKSVEVTPAAPAVAVNSGGPVKKDSVASQQATQVSAGYVGGALFKAMPSPPAQWMLSPTGAVQRSLDQGKTWQQVSVNGTDAGFRSVSSSGADVWVGGNAGALYHSTDSGLIWSRVTPNAGASQLTADIVRVEFSDGRNGTVTAGGQVWETADSGQTWQVTKK